MRSTIFAAGLLFTVLSTQAHARSMGADLATSQYIAIWKSAAPQAFSSGTPQGLRFVPDVMMAGEASCIEYITRFARDDSHESCELYEVGPSRLLARCGRDGKTVVGLYDAASKRKLDEFSIPGEEYDRVRLVHLTSEAGWDIRVESGNEAMYYAEVNGKLARVAAFGKRYLGWGYDNREPTADELRYLLFQRRHHNDALEGGEVALMRAIDSDGDGFNERLDLTSREVVGTSGKFAVRNSPRVTRTLTWNPKTHIYED